MRLLIGLTLCAFALVACKTQQEALVGKPPADEAAGRAPVIEMGSPSAKPRATYPPPALAVATWPYADDRTTFRLTWAGGKSALPLHESPDPNSPRIGEVAWSNGEEIPWLNTFVAVYEPARLRAKAEWLAEGDVFTSGYQTDVEHVSETIDRGQSVAVYLYAGAGQCYLGVSGKIIIGRCPPPEAFQGTFEGESVSRWYQPVKKVWWVQISSGPTTGWVPLDDRVIVDIESA